MKQPLIVFSLFCMFFSCQQAQEVIVNGKQKQTQKKRKSTESVRFQK